MIKAIIFDVGGVMLRTYDWTGRTKWDDALKLEHGTVEHTVFNSEMGTAAQHGRVSIDEHWQTIGRHFQLTQTQLTQMRADFWAGDRFDFEMINLIRMLRPIYKTGIISNAFSDLRMVLTAEFKVANVFDTIVVSSEEGVMKPTAAIYERTLERLGCAAEESIFIDDSQTNIQGANEVGIKTIFYKREMDLRHALEAAGVSFTLY